MQAQSKNIMWIGILALLVIAIVYFLFGANRFEQQLQTKATNTLAAANMEGAAISFEGRNALITLPQGSQALADKAKGLIAAIPGIGDVEIRILENTTEFAQQQAATEQQPPLSQLLADKHIEFKTNETVFTAQSERVLQQVAEVLKQYPDTIIEVQGHADAQGTSTSNQQLSEQRANMVVQYLKGNGIKTVDLIGVGYGATQPVASNDTVQGRQQNRRVEFAIK